MQIAKDFILNAPYGELKEVCIVMVGLFLVCVCMESNSQLHIRPSGNAQACCDRMGPWHSMQAQPHGKSAHCLSAR
jgi:hypothetical protein